MDPIKDDERDNPVVERDQLPSRGQDQQQARAFTAVLLESTSSRVLLFSLQKSPDSLPSFTARALI
jgi:hypothetical protein